MKSRKLLGLALVAALGTGCASLTASRTDTFTVLSNPPGGDVLVDGISVGKTPASVEIDKKRAPHIEVAMTGYQSQPCLTNTSPGAGYIVADAVLCAVLFPVGCISFIDADGAWNELDTRACHVNLQPAPPPAYGPVSSRYGGL